MSSRTLFGLVFLLAIAVASPPIEAQRATKIPKIGFLATTTLVESVAAFRQGLRELGYVDGKTVLLEVRSAEGKVERLPELVRQLMITA